MVPQQLTSAYHEKRVHGDIVIDEEGFFDERGRRILSLIIATHVCMYVHTMVQSHTVFPSVALAAGGDEMVE